MYFKGNMVMKLLIFKNVFKAELRRQVGNFGFPQK